MTRNQGLHRRLMVGAAALAVAAGLSVGAAAAQTEAKISYQPSLYWALPFHFATVNDWWSEVGLTPDFSIFPAGAPQIAAAAAGSWDMGGTGSVPAILGSVRFNIRTIGLTNDESKTNVLMVRGDRFDAISADPKSLAGERILLTTNSTVDYAARRCLAHYGLDPSDVQFVNLAQAQIITAITSANGDLAGVWAPNTYTLEERAGAKPLCSGADVGAIVPGALVVRADYADEHPDEVAKFLAVYLRGWSWARANPEEAKKLASDFYGEGGLRVSEDGLAKEFSLRPTFSLDEQLALMDRSQGASKVDGWFDDIAGFMTEVGTIPAAPDAADYISDDYLKRVAQDPKLRAFATEFDPN